MGKKSITFYRQICSLWTPDCRLCPTAEKQHQTLWTGSGSDTAGARRGGLSTRSWFSSSQTAAHWLWNTRLSKLTHLSLLTSPLPFFFDFLHQIYIYKMIYQWSRKHTGSWAAKLANCSHQNDSILTITMLSCWWLLVYVSYSSVLAY